MACEQLLIPLFEGMDKAPNNALTGLSRSQRNLVNEAIKSDDFEGKKGQRMDVWTPGCRILLIGMGKKESLGHRQSRNTGARVMSSLSKAKGLEICVRFTSGWTIERMVDFAEGMMLRDYEFLEHQQVSDDHISEPWSVNFQASPRYQDALLKGLAEVHSVVEGVHLARNLGNEPA
ncbi:MAG: M17 family peptidase N-terminal domain-containing protein, partial [Candidatus Thalassarchaeaceae archaeon]